ncbi:MAG TPA: rhodanese-like domain-containing protein [Gemmatimonadaceae bacterium]|nr:rhodanese-like domain-containing protein [Gemmatimonadaceae bacterium]
MTKLTRIRSHHVLAVMALMLGGSAAVARVPAPRTDSLEMATPSGSDTRETRYVSPVQLAQWIRDTKRGLRVLDVRDPIQFEEMHIPGAERIDDADHANNRFSPDETIVVYSDNDNEAARMQTSLRKRGHPQIAILRGGLSAWIEEILNPTLAFNATESAKKKFDRVAELSRYFGGVPRIAEPGEASASSSNRGAAGNPSVTQSAKRVRGRGC